MNVPMNALHIEKGISFSAGQSRHNLRQEWVVEADGSKRLVPYVPDNADPDKAHLNRVLVSQRWADADGVERFHSIEEQISHRIKEVGASVRKGQNTYLEIIASGDHDVLSSMDEETLSRWTNLTLQWARETFGADNIVNAVLHRDERTPHIHFVIVPIVTGISRKTRQYRERSEKENRRRKHYNVNTAKARLCVNEVFTRDKLYTFHDTFYARVGAHFGLSRGVKAEPGSQKRHTTSIEYNRMLTQEGLNLELENECRRNELEEQTLRDEAELRQDCRELQTDCIDEVLQMEDTATTFEEPLTDIEKKLCDSVRQQSNSNLEQMRRDALKAERRKLRKMYRTIKSACNDLNARALANIKSKVYEAKKKLNIMRIEEVAIAECKDAITAELGRPVEVKLIDIHTRLSPENKKIGTDYLFKTKAEEMILVNYQKIVLGVLCPPDAPSNIQEFFAMYKARHPEVQERCVRQKPKVGVHHL